MDGYASTSLSRRYFPGPPTGRALVRLAAGCDHGPAVRADDQHVAVEAGVTSRDPAVGGGRRVRDAEGLVAEVERDEQQLVRTSAVARPRPRPRAPRARASRSSPRPYACAPRAATGDGDGRRPSPGGGPGRPGRHRPRATRRRGPTSGGTRDGSRRRRRPAPPSRPQPELVAVVDGRHAGQGEQQRRRRAAGARSSSIWLAMRVTSWLPTNVSGTNSSSNSSCRLRAQASSNRLRVVAASSRWPSRARTG